MRLVLASTSPYRRALLERLRVPFEQESPGVDERELAAQGLGPEALAAALARAKADAVAARRPGAVVVGSDQVCALGDAVLDKPGDAERASAQLRRLRGREHRLATAVAVVHPGGVDEILDITRLRMRALSDAEVERYVGIERPFDCAGAYRIESAGIALFESIESADHTAIVGLPMIALSGLLRRLGFALP